MKADIFQRLLKIFFPPRCACCGLVISADNKFICDACYNGLSFAGEKTFPFNQVKKENYEFEKCLAPFLYSGSAKRGILGIKFAGRPYAAEFFGKEMARCIKQSSSLVFDIITCVPLSCASLKERGYNQSELLAGYVAKELGILFLPTLLKKIYDTPAQHSLAYIMRRGNVFGAYEITDENAVNNKTVLLIDDIITTGSTLNECAKMLKFSGAREVWCVAATGVANSKHDKQSGEI